MPTIVIRHKVGDFNTWLNGHQDRVELFSKFSSGFQTFQDTDDANSIVIAADVFDLEAMQAVLGDAEVIEKVAKQKHTVIEPVIVSLPVKV